MTTQIYLDDEDTVELDISDLLERDTVPMLLTAESIHNETGLVHINASIVRDLVLLLEQSPDAKYAAVRYLSGDCAEVTLDCPTLLYCPVTFTGVIHDGGAPYLLREDWKD